MKARTQWVAALMLGVSLPALSLGATKDKPAPVAATPADAAYSAYEKVLREQPPAGLDDAGKSAWYEGAFARVCDAADRFIKDFPQDPRRWKAADVYAMYAQNLQGYREMREKRAKELIAEGLKSPDIDDKAWQQLKSHEISSLMRPAYEASAHGGRPDLSDIRRAIDELAAHSPKSDSQGLFEMSYAGLLRQQNPELASAWVEYLTHNPNVEVAKLAKGRVAIDRMREEPPELKFTAVDGRQVDLAALRGKVVLIDFWATWCGPCVAELPNIKAAYDKYHARGFEVIGISLDRKNDRKKLEDFVAARKLPWPQSFDGENDINRVAQDYGIFSIPTPLLLGPDGLLVSDEARGDKLNEELKRLLGG